MKKVNFITNFAIIIFLMIVAIFSNEFYLSVFLIMSPVYIFFYMLYLMINRVKIFAGKGFFNDKLFLLPLCILLVYTLYFFCVVNIYKDMDDLVRANFEYDIYNINCDGCKINGDNLKVIKFIEKNYIFNYDLNCIYMHSPSYSLIKFNFKKCN